MIVLSFFSARHMPYKTSFAPEFLRIIFTLYPVSLYVSLQLAKTKQQVAFKLRQLNLEEPLLLMAVL